MRHEMVNGQETQTQSLDDGQLLSSLLDCVRTSMDNKHLQLAWDPADTNFDSSARGQAEFQGKGNVIYHPGKKLIGRMGCKTNGLAQVTMRARTGASNELWENSL